MISRSASGSTSVVLFPLLLSVLLSGVVEFTTATFVIVALVMFTKVLMFNTTLAPLVKLPIVQTPVSGLYLPFESSVW